MDRKLMSKITLKTDIEAWPAGKYTISHATQFIFDGQMHPQDAERLARCHAESVEVEYSDDFVWTVWPL